MVQQGTDAVTEVLMPLMGEGITEATLVRWLKNPGDQVAKGEPLLEVSTDKVDTEIPAPASGVLVEVLARDGDLVAINKVIGRLGGANAKAAATAMPPPPPKPATPRAAAATSLPLPPPPVTASGSQAMRPAPAASDMVMVSNQPAGRSSPLVRKMAKALAIDLQQVAGTGLHGRITKRDLEAFQADGGASAPAAAPTPAGERRPAHLEYGRLLTKREGNAEFLDGVPVRREKMSRMRALIAEHMVRSVRTSPHVTTVFEVDMHQVANVRAAKKAHVAARDGFNLTYTPFFVHAAVQALKLHPTVNCSVDGEDILWKDQINVGVAVAIDSGLIVPVIKNAGDLNLLGIARRLDDLAQRARGKKLLPEDIQGGTFSITNPGMFGSIVSSPIINQPQVAILSIGAIVKRPVVIDDLIGIRPLVQIGLTFDHRVVDGEGGARFLATMKQILESYTAAEI